MEWFPSFEKGYARLEQEGSPWCVVNLLAVVQWMRESLYVPVLISVVYAVTIFGLQRYMRTKEPFSLRRPLILWNAFLALYSIIAAVSTVPTFIYDIYSLGFLGELCMSSTEGYMTPWYIVFAFSKILELVDTLFIVLRKRPLIFLHWYHHIATLIFCWECVGLGTSTGTWFMAMNLVVHSIMYSYYCLSAMGYRFSQVSRLSITCLQILQMLMGITVITSQILYCPYYPERNTYTGLLMYLSYAILFIRFFVSNLFGSKRQHQPSSVPPKKKEA
ncbi:Elongation of very long chain fatty acids protein [Balamuthia mandrillaris]